jgi:hypothetical protein
MTTKKLNAEDVSAIENLKNEFQELYNIIGLLTIDEKSLEVQLERVKTERDLKFESFKNLSNWNFSIFTSYSLASERSKK